MTGPASPAFRAGLACGLLLSLVVLLGGISLALAFDWARANFAVISTDRGPVVIEEVHLP